MKSTLNAFLFISLLILTMSSFFSPALHGPCDAPLIQGGFTGAPGENSCGIEGCHTGNVNTGPAEPQLIINEGIEAYTPGQTYPVRIIIEQLDIHKFGFQVTVLKDSDNSFAGTFSLTDPVNTRLFSALGRKYVGTTSCGSDAPFPDSLSWEFEWQAPVTDEGNLTFYMVTLAANHDHSTFGDYVYTQSFQLSPAVTSVKALSTLEKSIRLFPNPSKDFVQLEYTLEQKEDINISLWTMKGKIIFQTKTLSQLPGVYQHQLDRTQLRLDSGVYLVKIQTETKSIIRKLTFI